jgi:hypothetical protein
VKTTHSRIPLIRKLVIRVANYLDLIGPSGKPFLTLTVLHLVMAEMFPQLSNTYKELCVNVLFVRKKICSLKQPFVVIFFSRQTTHVAYFQRKIQLSEFPAYPDGSSFQLIRIRSSTVLSGSCLLVGYNKTIS